MITMTEATAIFFRLLNFALLIGVLIYIYKKYIHASLQQAVRQKQIHKEGLQHKENTLQEEWHQLAVHQQAADAYIAQLKERIAVWQQYIQEQQQRREREHQQQCLKQKERIAVQHSYIQSEQLKRLVVPEAVEQATKELQKQFASPEAQRQFIASITQNLQRTL